MHGPESVEDGVACNTAEPAAVLELTIVPGQQAWSRLQDSAVQRLREARAAQILAGPLPTVIAGWCGSCQAVRDLRFDARYGAIRRDGAVSLNFNETGQCLVCGANSRMRAACDLLDALGATPDSHIYLTERDTPLSKSLAERRPQLTTSTYADGRAGEGFQDIQRLSFPDGAFDAVVCLDVLEHVPDPSAAVSEIRRVLRPGGFAILSFPFFPRRAATIFRARLSTAGQVEHLLPAAYHPSPDGPCLVYQEIAWDLVASWSETFPDELQVLNYWSSYSAHFGPSRFVTVIRRSTEGAR